LRIVFDRNADAGDVHVDRAAKGLQRLSPDAVHQLLSGQDPAGAAGHRRQQVELVSGEVPLVVIDAYPSRALIDLESAKAQHAAVDARARARTSTASQHGSDASQ